MPTTNIHTDPDLASAMLVLRSHSRPSSAVALVLDQLEALQAEVAELAASAELRHQADMRARQRWRSAEPGRELRWPDHADLCVWLLEQLDSCQAVSRGACE